VLALRGLLAAALYAFLILALIQIKRDAAVSLSNNQVHPPEIILTTKNGEPHKFAKREIFIGRESINDLVFNDDAISAKHAKIYYFGGRWMVEDQQSTNGTFLNDERIITPTILVDQDALRCGMETIAIHVPDYNETRKQE
jgi:pSer/pThr/pTyr-binding forkhead associated (FHA) protein